MGHLHPPPPPRQKKKMAKISHFCKFLDFYSLIITFCPPLNAPLQKISGAATAVYSLRITCIILETVQGSPLALWG